MATDRSHLQNLVDQVAAEANNLIERNKTLELAVDAARLVIEERTGERDQANAQFVIVEAMLKDKEAEIAKLTAASSGAGIEERERIAKYFDATTDQYDGQEIARVVRTGAGRE